MNNQLISAEPTAVFQLIHIQGRRERVILSYPSRQEAFAVLEQLVAKGSDPSMLRVQALIEG